MGLVAFHVNGGVPRDTRQSESALGVAAAISAEGDAEYSRPGHGEDRQRRATAVAEPESGLFARRNHLKFIRKALLPAFVAAGFLGFLGAIGQTSVPVVSAASGDICAIADGQDATKSPKLFIEEGEKVYYQAWVDNGYEDELTIDVDLNDFDGGDSDITSLNGTSIPQTDFLNDVELTNAGNVCGPTDAELKAATIKANYDLLVPYLLAAMDRGESCSAIPPSFTPIACNTNAFPGHNQTNDLNPGSPLHSWQDNDIDCGLVAVLGGGCNVSNVAVLAAAQSLATSIANGASCATAAAAAEATLIANWQGGYLATAEYIGGQLEDYLVNRTTPCGAGGAPFGGNAVFTAVPGTVTPTSREGKIVVDVTCDDPGVFDLSFAVNGGGAKSIEVVCGSDAETAEIFAVPTSIEINPSIANVAHSLVWISIKGDNGEVAFPGTEVQWTTDRCAIESTTVDTEDEFEAAETLFRGINPLSPATAKAVEESVYATTGPDGASRQQEEVNSFKVVGSAAGGLVERTISAVVLHCDPIHAPSVTPGPAVVTAYIERGDNDIDDNDLDGDISDNDDLVIKTTVTVVGPPAANGVTVTAAPASLACGEKATITVDVKDAAGQPVSDHTFVEAVTNAGGVLAGTGAVAGQAGLVTPVSSTVAETFGGKVTFYLLTSTANVGKYEVVVTTGGGGGVTGQLANGGVSTNLLGGLFTTAPISVQVTVECTVPAAPVVVAPAAPTNTAPATGQGIRPPSTGDAGLVSTDSNTWVAGAAFAVVAALVVAGFSVKLVREE